MDLTRKQVIDNLSYIMDSMPDDACTEWRDSLAYAISSLKTDEAYQIMYEGGEIFTKDEVVAMLTMLRQDLLDKLAEEKSPYHISDVGIGLEIAIKIIEEYEEKLK